MYKSLASSYITQSIARNYTVYVIMKKNRREQKLFSASRLQYGDLPAARTIEQPQWQLAILMYNAINTWIKCRRPLYKYFLTLIQL
jgi:hypothetical protein